MAADASLRSQYVPSTLVVPAGTPAAAPVVLTVVFGVALLMDLLLLIPPGHSGVTGFALRYNQTRVLPFTDGQTWIVGDDERIRFDLDLLVSGSIDLLGFNTGRFTHTFYVLSHVDLSVREQTAAAVIVPV